MAQQQDDDIGWEIVGLMPVPALAAMGAGGCGLEEAGEHPSLATGRAAPAQRQADGGGERAIGCGFGCLVGHGR